MHNKSGRHLSTGRAIQLLEEHGVETVQGLIKSPKGLLRKQTVNRWLSRWRLDQPRLLREPPAVRFQAENSNDCWQFDMSPSDLKHIERPDWVDPARGDPTLMLFSVVDDRSGVAYQEYRCVYGEDAESALRFLFNAMAPKARSDFPFQGRPKLLYLDNGPVAKSHVFQNVMQIVLILVFRRVVGVRMIDVLAPEKRRRRSVQEKIAIVQQSFEPGMTVSLVARQHGVAASQLFLWRKQYQEGSLTAVAAGG